MTVVRLDSIDRVRRFFFASRNSKTRSAAAAVDCSTLAILAICVMGWVNDLTYWMKARISPTRWCPDRQVSAEDS